MHLYPRRRNVAAQVVVELKAATYAPPPPYGGTQKEESLCACVQAVTAGALAARHSDEPG